MWLLTGVKAGVEFCDGVKPADADLVFLHDSASG